VRDSLRVSGPISREQRPVSYRLLEATEGRRPLALVLLGSLDCGRGQHVKGPVAVVRNPVPARHRSRQRKSASSTPTTTSTSKRSVAASCSTVSPSAACCALTCSNGQWRSTSKYGRPTDRGPGGRPHRRADPAGTRQAARPRCNPSAALSAAPTGPRLIGRLAARILPDIGRPLGAPSMSIPSASEPPVKGAVISPDRVRRLGLVRRTLLRRLAAAGTSSIPFRR
jgi:hypothetical protein